MTQITNTNPPRGLSKYLGFPEWTRLVDLSKTGWVNNDINTVVFCFPNNASPSQYKTLIELAFRVCPQYFDREELEDLTVYRIVSHNWQDDFDCCP